MSSDFGHLPVFAFAHGTKAKFKGRDVVFGRKTSGGYMLEYRPHPDAASIPATMIGTRPDIEFVGQKFHPHAELSSALVSGDLMIEEGDYHFIDDSQRFRVDIVANLEPKRAERTIIRYASVMARRDMGKVLGRSRGLDRHIEDNEGEFLALVRSYRKRLTKEVEAKAKRRHPFRKENELIEPVTARKAAEWDRLLQQSGFGLLVDGLNRSGNRSSRFHPDVVRIVHEVIEELNKPEKIFATHVHGEVRRRVKELAANWPEEIARREAEGEVIPDHIRKLPAAPSYEAIRVWVNNTGKLRRLGGERGIDWLLRNRISKGMGIEVTRAGQIVICDEYDTDLFTLVSHMQIAEWIGWAKLKEMGIAAGLNAVRCTLSVMIDVYTECILALKISLHPSAELAKGTLMMAMMDKTRLSRAMGCLSDWNHMLRPEVLLTDGGSAYTSMEMEKYCSWCGIDHQIAPSGLANLRGVMERLFRTIHISLLARFPGRTFKDVVERGEYNSEANAVLTLDEFVHVLTHWVVDFYHNDTHGGLGDNITPNDVWYHEMTRGQGVRPVPSIAQMARTFGTTLKRTPQDTGIQVMRLHYDSPAFMRWRGRPGRKRPLRVCWWEERLDLISVEVEPDTWMDLEVMDPAARGKCLEEWLIIWQRREIERIAGREAAKDHALDEIEHTKEYALQMRGKVIRPTLDALALAKLEERMDCFTKYPSNRLTSEQTHGVTGVAIIGDMEPPATLPPLPESVTSPSSPKLGADPDGTSSARPRKRDPRPDGWETGGME